MSSEIKAPNNDPIVAKIKECFPKNFQVHRDAGADFFIQEGASKILVVDAVAGDWPILDAIKKAWPEAIIEQEDDQYNHRLFLDYDTLTQMPLQAMKEALENSLQTNIPDISPTAKIWVAEEIRPAPSKENPLTIYHYWQETGGANKHYLVVAADDYNTLKIIAGQLHIGSTPNLTPLPNIGLGRWGISTSGVEQAAVDELLKTLREREDMRFFELGEQNIKSLPSAITTTNPEHVTTSHSRNA